jgi:hypothetical protein
MAHAVFATYGELCREFTGQQEALSAQAASLR